MAHHEPSGSIERIVGGAVLRLHRGDITRFEVDAIVNAANSGLAGGGGVDGAIHRAGGPAIAEACRRIGGCKTGDAVATVAGTLPARHVIHAVAPVWRGGQHGESGLLRSAYRRSLEVADEVQSRTLAFPSLGTGAYRYPVRDAAAVALSTVMEYLQGVSGLKEVLFVLFSDADLETYADVLRALMKEDSPPMQRRPPVQPE